MNPPRIEREVGPPVRRALEAIRSARNKRDGLRAFELLARAFTARSNWADLAKLVCWRESFDLYSRRLLWDLKVHLIEWCVIAGGQQLAERLDRALKLARLQEMRRWLIERVVSEAEASWTAAYGARRLAEGDADVRRAVKRGISLAAYGDRVSAGYAVWATSVLVEAIARRPRDRTDLLASLHAFSESDWRRLSRPRRRVRLVGGGPFRVVPIPHPWGDYWNALAHGFASREKTGTLVVDRTGPFVPPVTLPSRVAVVVTDAMKRKLAMSGLTGVGFRHVDTGRLVRHDWHQWDRDVPKPVRYPPGGESEAYVYRRKHVPQLRRALGALWELVPTGGDFEALESPWNPTVVSTRAAEWLLAEAGEWISFEPVHAKRR